VGLVGFWFWGDMWRWDEEGQDGMKRVGMDRKKRDGMGMSGGGNGYEVNNNFCLTA
jgi:hypothetical protein